MSSTLIAEQLLNGLGYRLMLFLLAAGLTLVSRAAGRQALRGPPLTAAVKTGQGLPMLAFLSRRASLH
jgi:hypothetical protein